ncbi:DMT family transporter [Marivivens donghaensis]|uniref:DMT family transporter n=1 Tax=Marivivens donghaensis TaxID=1699413 RepID=A0ABX0VXQ5_9RHOB|nr:DMT family transporter [Marivivens donghaensis]NIY71679.1 DMT family transporter [Marivivens donghaensis]
MTEQNTRLGIILMICATFIFAMQDGLSRHLADTYDVRMVVMVRYWFFAAFVIFMAKHRGGSVRKVASSKVLGLQIFRGVLLVAEICMTIVAFVRLGLVEAHAIFACYPLLIVAFSGPVLGEKVGWKRWSAIAVGFLGVLVILQPGYGVFTPDMLWALIAAVMFAVYGILTRYVARHDRPSTSFFWTGVSGAIAMTAVGIWYWEPMSTFDWFLMATLCVSAASGHYILIKVYDVAEASAVQPFAYLQLPFASSIGVLVFHDTLRINVVVGAIIVVSAGLFTFFRERKKKLAAA